MASLLCFHINKKRVVSFVSEYWRLMKLLVVGRQIKDTFDNFYEHLKHLC